MSNATRNLADALATALTDEITADAEIQESVNNGEVDVYKANYNGGRAVGYVIGKVLKDFRRSTLSSDLVDVDVDSDAIEDGILKGIREVF